MSPELPSWNDTPARSAIVAFAEAVADEGGPGFVPPEERVAVFDNDGTLWCEKPMPVQVDFIVRRLAAMAEADPSLRDHQPWKSAYERDLGWLGGAMVKHYEGDDSDVKTLIAALIRAFGGMDVEDYGRSAAQFLAGAEHPTLGRPYRECTFAPMTELLRYLEAHGFACYIASGGDRDFMRPAAHLYGIPLDRVVGSSFGLEYRDAGGGSLVYASALDVFDDGPQKPVRIWSRVGRRPILAAGNSNGDIPMLRWSGGARPALRLLLLHDDADREFSYTAGAEDALKAADAGGWTVVSMARDWSQVFPA
jgi:phosphoserine phosphatase